MDPNNFPGLFDYYSRYFKVKKADGTYHYPNGTPQHNLMAQHYLGFITDALMEFDGVDPNNNANAQIKLNYEALAWFGLEETIVWKNMPSYEKLSIINLRNILVNAKPKCN